MILTDEFLLGWRALPVILFLWGPQQELAFFAREFVKMKKIVHKFENLKIWKFAAEFVNF